MMMQQAKPDDYVLATGEQKSVREFLEFCLQRAGIKWTKQGKGNDEIYKDAKGKTIVAIDTRYQRPSEVDLLLGDASKAKKQLGWKPKTTLEELATLMLEADCKKLGVKLYL